MLYHRRLNPARPDAFQAFRSLAPFLLPFHVFFRESDHSLLTTACTSVFSEGNKGFIQKTIMELTLQRINKDHHFRATNENGSTIDMDGTSEIGGVNAGMRPMQTLLASLAGCSSIDVISILRKQKINPVNYSLKITAERETEGDSKIFTDIHIHFIFEGDIDDHKAARAIELSLTKYCSVARIISKTANITSSFEIKRTS
jgi:putative redox protein